MQRRPITLQGSAFAIVFFWKFQNPYLCAHIILVCYEDDALVGYVGWLCFSVSVCNEGVLIAFLLARNDGRPSTEETPGLSSTKDI
jgi:hypothetical protein